ncbi:hypothetical protein J5I95_17460 [Candidatus Poribacteria bacterium]|nr:hypothetical protein [Candidatus Poribacteria bacterium]
MFPTPFKRIAIVCGISILFFLLWKATHTQSKVQPESTVTLKTENNIRSEQPRRRRPSRAFNTIQTSEREDLQNFQESEFYRAIIDNNIFRPLGWRPKKSPAAYRLIGTVVFADGKSSPQAIIQTTLGNQTHIITIGDTLAAGTTVTDIQNKQVILDKAGKQTTLKLNASPVISTSKRYRIPR